MKASSVLGIALVMAGVAMVLFAMGAHGATITVPGDYGMIQDAIDHADDGDTIIVSGGPYHENVVIDREITLQGTGMPVIDGMGGTAINITASNVTINGFNITNASYGINCSALGFTIVNNVVDVTVDGIHMFLHNIGCNMTGSSSFIMGDSIVYNNAINATDDGIEIDAMYWGCNMSDNALFEIGKFLIDNNTINSSDDGIFIHAEEFGHFMEDNASFRMGDFSFDFNRINSSGGDGISSTNENIQIFGYGMYDNALFAMKNITFNGNIIHSDGGDGVSVDYITYFGYNMSDNASFSMGDITFNGNVVVCRYTGIYTNLEHFGEYMSGNTLFTMGDASFDGNNVSCYNGIYVDYIYGFGADMEHNASFTMGNITFNDNIIDNASFKGIYIYEIGEYLGYNMSGNASFIMGNIESTGNTVTTDSSEGIIFEHIDGIGYNMGDRSSLILGTIIICGNVIEHSGSDGIYIRIDEIGYNMSGDATASMALVNISDNTINSSDDGIYFEYLDYLGYEMYDSAQFSFGGLHVTGNHINGSGYAIYLPYIQYWGYEMHNDAIATFGDIIFADNIINMNSDGIYSHEYFIDWIGSYLYDNASFTLGNILFTGNDINASGDGIYIQHVENLGYEMYNNSLFTMGDFAVDGNTINAGDYGIYLYNMIYFGYEMYNNSVFTMGNISFSGNDVTAGSDGIYIENIEYFGELYNYSSFLMGDWQFNGNTITSNDDGIYVYFYEMAYDMDDYSTFIVNGTTFIGNTIESGEYGIYLELDDMPYDIDDTVLFTWGSTEICDNTVWNCSYDGIYIYYYLNFYGTISGNTVWNCGGNGIYLEGYDGELEGTVEGNTLFNCDGYGLYLYVSDNQMDMDVLNNTVYNNSYGICVDTGDDHGIYSHISGNTIYENTYDGVHIKGSNTSTIGEGDTVLVMTGNVITDNGGRGIAVLNRSDGAYMNNNEIINNSDGIYFEVYHKSDFVMAHSGTHVWYSGAGAYTNKLLTRSFDLSSVTTAYLNFSEWYATEDGCDYCNVEINNGSGWVTLDTYDDNSLIWLDKSYDISAHTGGVVQIRFRYETDSCCGHRGWYIDDIAIDAIGFFDDVEGAELWSASPNGWKVVELFDMMIGNNIISECTGSPSGIHMEGMENVTIEGNTIFDCSYGIYLSNSSNNSFFSNLIYNCSYGIFLNASCNHSTIENNTIRDNDVGIYVYGGWPMYGPYENTDTEIHWNRIYNNTEYGLIYGVFSMVPHSLYYINATWNWWGAVDGPGSGGGFMQDPVTGTYATGDGDWIAGGGKLDNIHFDPWLGLMLYEGWNLVSPGFIGDVENASDLAAFINEHTHSCTIVSMWDAVQQKYVSYVVGFGFDFSLVNGSGYFVYVTEDVDIYNFSEVELLEPEINITLLPGYNLLGWPFVGYISASELADNITHTLKVGTYDAELQIWLPEYFVTMPIFDFDVLMGEGVFVYVTEVATWTVEMAV